MLVAQNSLGPVCPVPLTVRGSAAALAVDEAGDRRGLLVVVTQEFGVKLGGASPGGDERHKGRRRTSTQDIFEAVAVKACLPQKKTSLTQSKKGFSGIFFVLQGKLSIK